MLCARRTVVARINHVVAQLARAIFEYLGVIEASRLGVSLSCFSQCRMRMPLTQPRRTSAQDNLTYWWSCLAFRGIEHIQGRLRVQQAR